jgi:hypothetical protein
MEPEIFGQRQKLPQRAGRDEKISVPAGWIREI